MNDFLQKRLQELENSEQGQCWYIVKQQTDFSKLCYLVSFLDDYKKTEKKQNLESYISEKISEINAQKGLGIADNYRTLLVASYFGLINKAAAKGLSYVDADISQAFYEIKNRCDGDFDNYNLYKDLAQRQIEKMYIATPADDYYETTKKKFRLFPIPLLYKILLEIGRTTTKYSISISEFEYLVVTTERYEDYLSTLLFIRLFREEPENENIFSEKLAAKFDNRIKQVIRQLECLDVNAREIVLKENYIEEVSKKITYFENHSRFIPYDKIISFQCSTQSLWPSEKEIYKEEKMPNITDSTTNFTDPEQIIFYGVPGSGKSHTIKEKLKNEYNITEGNEDLQVMRTVFHPEYTNADFIGQILPRITEGKTEFEFKPGPFTKILKRAMCDPLKRYVLVVEEINRGNAAAIFGDLFQLLDRIEDEEEKTSYDGGVNHFGKGWSDYFVMNSEINNFIRDSRDDFDGKAVNISGIHFSANTGIRLPPNLSILATMNTSDQNVFTLDNAFQRRFEKILIRNEFYVTNITDENLKKQIENQRDANIETTNCTWGTFQVKINERISETAQEMGLSSMEDKRLGCWFVKNKNGIITREQFAGNVLKYLWDDAFKFNRSSIFSEEFNNFEELSKAFLVENKGLSIFTIPFNEE